MEWILIAIGGGVGASLRYFVIMLMKKLHRSGEWATAFVNLVGSFIMGIVTSNLVIQSSPGLFITVGLLGGFTTFSTFSFEITYFIFHQKWMKLFFYSVVNIFGGILLFLLGFSI